jgi:glycosyltransferase involved in cell wall biosynthesis
MIKISSVVLAKNEEANIRRCIESQLNCIDEIVILIDNSTTDKTEEIVRKYDKVNYELVKWNGYAKTKMYGVSKTTNRWIFWIDADEEISPELSNEILELKKSSPQYLAYSVARRAFFLGKWIKHSGWYPGRVVRLFDKEKVTMNDKEVHEHLDFNGQAGNLKNDLNHYTDPSIEHYYEKFNRYTSLAAKDLLGRNKKFTLTGLLFRPFFLFVKMYIFRLGFLDGKHGLILSALSANYVFTKYAKLWELSRKES